jgi:hypothetical protein
MFESSVQSAIAADQILIQTSKPFGNEPLFVQTVQAVQIVQAVWDTVNH